MNDRLAVGDGPLALAEFAHRRDLSKLWHGRSSTTFDGGPSADGAHLRHVQRVPTRLDLAKGAFGHWKANPARQLYGNRTGVRTVTVVLDKPKGTNGQPNVAALNAFIGKGGYWGREARRWWGKWKSARMDGCGRHARPGGGGLYAKMGVTWWRCSWFLLRSCRWRSTSRRPQRTLRDTCDGTAASELLEMRQAHVP
jgi:hypothetical protein